MATSATTGGSGDGCGPATGLIPTPSPWEWEQVMMGSIGETWHLPQSLQAALRACVPPRFAGSHLEL